MDEVFGLAMSGILMVLLVLLGLCLLSVVWVALRRPVIFRLGMRNIPRRKAQTILIVVGLMLSTLIMSAALGTGDTLDYSLNSDIYDTLGHVDELVVASNNPTGEATVELIGGAPFDAAALDSVTAAVAGNQDVDGVLAMLETRAAVIDQGTSLAEPDVVVVGLDPAAVEDFGGLRTTGGESIDLTAIGSTEVVISEALAEDLEASVGDQLSVYIGEEPATLTVATIAEDSYLSGARNREVPGLAMSLAAVQELTGMPGQLTSIAVSNAGGVRDSLDPSDSVSASLRTALTGQGLGVDPIKDDWVESGEKTSGMFTAIFLVLGLFSVSAGVLLIVLIFTMLASERRSEMGMARAVGAQRRHLIQQFISEGSGYAILAGVVGSALGVAATYGIALGMQAIFGKYVSIEPHVEPRSLLVAYCLGVIITFLTVVGSSWKISRLNIVAAVRDIPDVQSPKRKLKTLVWATLLLGFGGLLASMGQGSANQFFFMTGLSLVPFGVAIFLRFCGVPSRPVFTTVGLALLTFWLLPEKTFTDIFGEYDGGIEMFFVSGIFMVIAATIVIVNNLDILLAGVGRLGGIFQKKLPAIRTAIAYPGAAKGRTGLTIAMFSLIVFSLVMIAAMSTNYSAQALGDEADAGWDVRAVSYAGDPVPDLAAALDAAGVDTTGYETVGVVHGASDGSSDLRIAGNEDADWKRYTVNGMDETFLTESELSFGQRATGYETDAAILEALRTRTDVAVVDSWTVPDGDLGGNDDQFMLKGVSPDDETFAPVTVETIDPRDGSIETLTIIGVLDESIGSLHGLYAPDAAITAIYGPPAATAYYVALDDTERAESVAKEIEAALLSDGVQGFSIQEELAEAQRQENGFLYIIQGFMGLGLVVGIAAVGVIAFRSVVERRQQIGVLRAIGFQRGLVATSFMIETSFMVGLGGFAGTVLGLVLARNLFTSDAGGGSSDSTFLIPWTILIAIAVLTNAAALLMTWIPARQAGRIAPAEALRYE